MESRIVIVDYGQVLMAQMWIKCIEDALKLWFRRNVLIRNLLDYYRIWRMVFFPFIKGITRSDCQQSTISIEI